MAGRKRSARPAKKEKSNIDPQQEAEPSAASQVSQDDDPGDLNLSKHQNGPQATDAQTKRKLSAHDDNEISTVLGLTELANSGVPAKAEIQDRVPQDEHHPRKLDSDGLSTLSDAEESEAETERLGRPTADERLRDYQHAAASQSAAHDPDDDEEAESQYHKSKRRRLENPQVAEGDDLASQSVNNDEGHEETFESETEPQNTKSLPRQWEQNRFHQRRRSLVNSTQVLSDAPEDSQKEDEDHEDADDDRSQGIASDDSQRELDEEAEMLEGEGRATDEAQEDGDAEAEEGEEQEGEEVEGNEMENDEDTAAAAEEDDEEKKQKRAEAMSAMADIEIGFAKLRDKLFDEKWSELDKEAQLVNKGIHPQLNFLIEQITDGKRSRTVHAERTRDLRSSELKERLLAAKHQLHYQLLYDKRDLRKKMLDQISSRWFQLHRERRRLDISVPEYGYVVPDRRSTQIRDRRKKDYEVAMLTGIKNYIGFPSAPEVGSATSDEIQSDLSAMGLNIAMNGTKQDRKDLDAALTSTEHSHPIKSDTRGDTSRDLESFNSLLPKANTLPPPVKVENFDWKTQTGSSLNNNSPARLKKSDQIGIDMAGGFA